MVYYQPPKKAIFLRRSFLTFLTHEKQTYFQVSRYPGIQVSRYPKLITLLFISSFFLFQSCEKENLLNDPSADTTATASTPTVNYANTQGTARNESAEPVKTELGKFRQNPYTVAEMTAAFNTIHGTNEVALPTTHTYVKFTPSSIAHIDLLEASDIILQDYPFEYEVTKEGDFYQEPAEGEYPEFYGVVEAGKSIAEIPHEIIAPLHLDKSNPVLLAQSYFQTGNQSEIFSEILPDNGLYIEDIPLITLNSFDDPPICDEGCRPILVSVHGSGEILPEPEPGTPNPFDFVWECDCTPLPPPPPPTLNRCDCPVPANPRIPAGCVQVYDTELSNQMDQTDFDTYLPVRRVKVTMSDGWFSFDETETDDNGCWSMPNERYGGRARMWVHFTNDRARIRGSRATWKFWELFETVNHYTGRFSGPFNNIETNFPRGADNGTKTRRLWGSATVNNALHEFHDYTIADGILPPSDGLDIFLDHDESFGFAIMSTQFELSIAGGGATGTASAISILGLNPFVTFFSWAAVLAYLPDITIGYDFNDSDALKELSYHEFAHAMHYRQVGHDFWLDLVQSEIEASFTDEDGNPHGNQFSDNADLIALCESWAHHLGHTYADRSYPGIPANRRNNTTDTWLQLLEDDINERPNHIPEGLYHDLIDNTTDTNGVIDNVSGFNNEHLFSCLSAEIRSIEEFRQCIIENHLANSGSTLINLNNLFNSY